MRQIDSMTPEQLEELKLKDMLPSKSPFTPLHPTLKACKCGFIGTRSALYKHFKLWKYNMTPKGFFEEHGEVPLNEDDPRLPKDCDWCNGTGTIEGDDVVMICEKCEGTGKLHNAAASTPNIRPIR